MCERVEAQRERVGHIFAQLTTLARFSALLRTWRAIKIQIVLLFFIPFLSCLVKLENKETEIEVQNSRKSGNDSR